MTTASVAQQFTTRDVNGAHLAEGMFATHITSGRMVSIHKITESGDVTVYEPGYSVPLTTRGVFLEALVNIKCAHCKGYHSSVGQVRDCGASHNAAKVFAEPKPDGHCDRCGKDVWTRSDGTLMGHPCVEPVPPARPAYVTLRENAKSATEIVWCHCPAYYQRHEFNQEFCAPRNAPLSGPALAKKIPDGRYAIDRDGKVRFYRVSCPTEGKWAGRVFLDRQNGDDYRPVRDSFSRNFVLDIIAHNPAAASMAYGRHIGSCGVCGRTLTNAESREAGIGPVCRERMGW